MVVHHQLGRFNLCFTTCNDSRREGFIFFWTFKQFLINLDVMDVLVVRHIRRGTNFAAIRGASLIVRSKSRYMIQIISYIHFSASSLLVRRRFAPSIMLILSTCKSSVHVNRRPGPSSFSMDWWSSLKRLCYLKHAARFIFSNVDVSRLKHIKSFTKLNTKFHGNTLFVLFAHSKIRQMQMQKKNTSQ